MKQGTTGASPVDVLRKHRINAIFTIDDARHAAATARALAEAGIRSVEVTMRTPAALKAIERIAVEVPEVTVGAGTVLTPKNVRDVKAAGGKFCIAPGFNEEMIDCCLENSIPVIPGVATPTEMEMALRHGLSILKVYPIVPLGGIAFLRLVNGPFRNLEWVPSGGLTQEMLAEYLAYDKIVACGCTWFAPTEVIAAEKFDLIRETARAAVAVAEGGTTT